MATYFECNALCTTSGDDGFTVGNVYEVVEVNGVRKIENNLGQEIECSFFSGGIILCRNSKFEEM